MKRKSIHQRSFGRLCGVLFILGMACTGAFILAGPPGALAESKISAREFNSGVSLFKREEFELSSDVFQKLMDQYPDGDRIDEVKYWYAETRHRLKDFTGALETFRKVIADHPASKYRMQSLFGAGYAAYNLSQYSDAAGFFVEASRKDEVGVIGGEGLILAADCYTRIKDTAKAEEVLRELLARPKLEEKYQLEGRYKLGRILIDRGQETGAMEALKPVTANAESERQADALLSVGDMFYERGRYRESLEWYEKVTTHRLSTDEMKARAQWNAAWSELTLGRDTSAERRFKAVTEMPGIAADIRADAWLRMAMISRRAGRGETAFWRARSALEIAETASLQKLGDEIHIFLAEGAYLRNNYDSALEYIDKVQEQTHAYLQLKGQIFFDSRRYAEALPFFEKAVGAAADASARNLSTLDLAQTQFNLKSYDASASTLSRIQDPAPLTAMNAEELYGKIHLAAGRYKEAAEKYGRLAELKPDSSGMTEAYYYSALAYQKAGMTQEAKAQLEKIQNYKPSYSLYRAASYVLLGDVLMTLQQTDTALRSYRKGAEDARDTETVNLAYTHLIEALIKVRPSEAATACERFAERLPESRTYLFNATNLYDARKFGDVLVYAQSILDSSPAADTARANAHFFAMAARFELKEYDAAKESLQKLLKAIQGRPAADPMVEESVFWDCRINQSAQNAEGARRAYQSYLEKYPSGKYILDAKFQLGLLGFDGGRAEEAEKMFVEVLAGRSAADAVAQGVQGAELLIHTVYNLASVKISRKDYAGAREMLSALQNTSQYSQDRRYQYQRAFVEMQLGELKGAEALYLGIVRDTASPRAVVDRSVQTLADMYYRNDRFDDLFRIQEQESARMADPAAQAHVLYVTAMVCFNREHYDSAARLFSRIKETPDTAVMADALLKNADCQYNLGNFRKALKEYEGVESRFPSSRWSLEAVYGGGLCRVKLNLPAEAVGSFEGLLASDPKSALAANAAMEAAKIYFGLGQIEQAMEKIKLIESGTDNRFKPDASRLRVKMAEKKNDPDEVYREAVRHTKLFGADGDVVLAALQSAGDTSKFEEGLKMLDGVAMDKLKPEMAARLDFYKAECLRLLGKSGSDELYQRLASVTDSEVRLSAGYRYAGVLVTRNNAAQAMEALKPVLSEGQSFKFYEEAILFGIVNSKNAGLNDQTISVYEGYASRLTEEKSRITAAEAYFSACLAKNDREKALKAVDVLMSLKISQKRQAELMLSSAGIYEDMGKNDKALELYAAVAGSGTATADLRSKAEDRRLQLDINNGSAAREKLLEYLSGNPDPKRGAVVAEKLLSDAMTEKRYKDAVAVVELIQKNLPKTPPSARYRAALAKMELGDTEGALEHFSVLAAKSPDTFYSTWSALKLGEYAYTQKSFPKAEPHLKQAWNGRTNLTDAAVTSLYKLLAGIYLEQQDVKGMDFLAQQSVPSGADEEANFIRGFAAFRSGDFAAAAGFLKPVASKEARAKRTYADALVRTGDTTGGIAVLDELASTRGPAAAAAQLQIAVLRLASGGIKDAVIDFYKVLDQYDPEENEDVAPAAMLGIVQAHVKDGKPEKADAVAADLAKKYPKSKEAAEAQKLAKKGKK